MFESLWVFKKRKKTILKKILKTIWKARSTHASGVNEKTNPFPVGTIAETRFGVKIKVGTAKATVIKTKIFVEVLITIFWEIFIFVCKNIIKKDLIYRQSNNSKIKCGIFCRKKSKIKTTDEKKSEI